MLRTPGLQKRRSNPRPCDLRWHLSAQCSSDLAWVATALSACLPACLPAWAQVLPAAPQQSNTFVSAYSLKSQEAKINLSCYENTRDKTHLNCHLIHDNSQTERYLLAQQHAHLSVCRCHPEEQTAGRCLAGFCLSNFRKHKHFLVLSSGSKSI